MVTLEVALQYLGITNPTAAQSSLIELLITLVTGEIEAYTGAVLVAREVSETLQVSRDFDYSVVPAVDISSSGTITRLSYSPASGLIITNVDGIVSSSSYLLDSNTGVISVLENFFSYGGDVTATYTAGYDPIPAELQLVALQGIKQYYSESGTVIQGSGNIKSKSLDRFSVSYNDNNQQFASGSKSDKQYLAGNSAILNRYKSWMIWG